MQLKQLGRIFAHRATIVLGILALLASGALSFTSASAAGNAMVRIIHASPEAGTVAVFVDGTKLLSNFEFGTVHGYVPLGEGSHKIQVAPAGQGANAAVITQTVSVNANTMYTVAAIGTKATGFSLQAFVDNNMVNPGKAKVRVYHLSPNAGPVDVATGGTKVITGLTYKNASDYLSVDPGAYTFNVTATDANATIPVSATLNANTVNSVFAVGLFKGTPELKFVLDSVAGTPSGAPQTGSDPNAGLVTNPLMAWVLGTLAVLLISTSLLARRFVQGRR